MICKSIILFNKFRLVLKTVFKDTLIVISLLIIIIKKSDCNYMKCFQLNDIASWCWLSLSSWVASAHEVILANIELGN